MNSVSKGIYLVIDPNMKPVELFQKLEQVLQEKIAAVQIWDHWKSDSDKEEIICDICNLCHHYHVPVFINNDWKLLKTLPLDGVHFDAIPEHYDEIKQELQKEFLAGITCNNDLSVVEWAEQNKMDYLSFCSMFQSSTSNSCELVSFQVVKQARKLTSMPIFLAGGIQLTNVNKLKELDYDGLAIISGIMNADDSASATKQYLENLNK